MTNNQYKNDELPKQMINENNATRQQQKYVMNYQRNNQKLQQKHTNPLQKSL